jgi:pseudouridine synthase
MMEVESVRSYSVMTEPAQRLQKILSQWGIASRRHAETLIREGRVRVNGRVASIGDKANPQSDRLTVDGKPLRVSDRPDKIYLLIHKPPGTVSSCSDPQNRPTLLDLLPAELAQGQGLHPVGRLDIESSGAILLTNDGELTLRLTHPRYHLPKTYKVWVSGHPTEDGLRQWREGVMLMGKKTLPAEVSILSQRPDRTLLRIVLTEGRNRQIRRVAEELGHEVLRLHRLAIGSIRLQPRHEPELPRGGYRFLTPSEVNAIRHHAYSDSHSVPNLNKSHV